MKCINGTTALLTGGSRGLGPYIARTLAREGVNLALNARSSDGLRACAETLTHFNIRVDIYPADLTDHTARLRLCEDVNKDFGPVDLLINNAGMEWVSAYIDLPTAHIEEIIQTNLIAPMLLTRLLLPDMLAQEKGHVVTMSSLGGKKGSPFSATYAATKAGLIEWSHGLREELRGTGVSASVICPGFVSEAGMFAVYKKKAPKLTGEISPVKVADAVVRAIKKDIGEIIVNAGPVRPMMLLDAVHPGIMTWVLRNFGVYDFYRRQAGDNRKQAVEQRTEESTS